MKLRLLLPLLLAASTAFPQSAADLDARHRKLTQLVDEIWEHRLATSPEFASIQGDRRWNDQLSDRSAAAIAASAKKAREFLTRAEAISTKGLDEQDAITKTIAIRQLRDELDDFRLKSYEMPITQFGGVYLSIPQYAPLMPFATEKDFTDWIARMHQVPRAFDDTIDVMRSGMRDGLMPPKILLEKAASQIEGLAKTPAEESPFAEPLKKLPASIDATRQAAIRAQLLDAIRTDVLPAYAKLAKFVREEYAPHGREQVGMWALPNGAERYATLVRRMTTTSMTPEEIHQLGLREVARDEAEMLVIAKKLGFDSVAALNASIDANPALHAKSRENILENFRSAIAAMYEKLPLLFNRLPKQRVEVKATEPFREKTAATQYQRGTRDGSRPGYVVVVTYKPEERKTLSNEATAYHEGVPGHHLQTAIAQELPGLSPFRQQSGFTAFSEGWALYAERLGKEVGLYKDPYSDYGRLQSDIFRAVRLVVDTGMHAKKWTREQAVEYMKAHTDAVDVTVQAEIDRYIAIPAQALSYKVGQLHILSLRDKAEKALGEKFDLREFHDEVLAAGSIPLDVLTQRIDAWIARKQREKVASLLPSMASASSGVSVVATCKLPPKVDTKGWKKVTAADGSLAIDLPAKFHRPKTQATFIHGGEVWESGRATVKMVYGHWGDYSFEPLTKQCTLTIHGLEARVFSEGKAGDPGKIVWFVGSSRVSGGVDVALDLSSDRPEDDALLMTIAQTARKP